MLLKSEANTQFGSTELILVAGDGVLPTHSFTATSISVACTSFCKLSSHAFILPANPLPSELRVSAGISPRPSSSLRPPVLAAPCSPVILSKMSLPFLSCWTPRKAETRSLPGRNPVRNLALNISYPPF